MSVESSGKPDAMKVARPVWGWGRDAISQPTPQLIGDVPSATAILDRFLHHAEVIPISGRSYRLRNQTTAAPESAAEASSNPAIPPTGSPPSGKRKKATAEPVESCGS